jgi:hypothetical protein
LAALAAICCQFRIGIHFDFSDRTATGLLSRAQSPTELAMGQHSLALTGRGNVLQRTFTPCSQTGEPTVEAIFTSCVLGEREPSVGHFDEK